MRNEAVVRVAIVWCYAVATLLAGCAGDGGATSRPVVRDSAGVRIVEHVSADPDVPRWSVDPSSATLFDGAGTGVELFQVREAVRLGDGRIAVADGGNHRIVLFRPDGSDVMTVGRSGAGPGEFQHLTLLSAWRGDSLIAWDRQGRRLSVFSGDGRFVRSFMLESTESVPFANVAGFYADGSMLAGGFTETGEGGPTTGVRRYPSPMYHFGADGSFQADLGSLPGGEAWFETIERGFTVYPALLARSTVRVAGPEHLITAANDTYELRVLTPAGALTGIIRRSAGPVPVTAEHRAAAEQVLLDDARNEDARTSLRAVLRDMPTPETLPAYGRVFADPLSRIWVEEYAIEEALTALWHVYAPDGTALAVAELPGGFRPTSAGEDWMLGVLTDELGEEKVMLAGISMARGPETRSGAASR